MHLQRLGKGPGIILTDASGRGLITHPKVKELLISVAEEEEIPISARSK